MKYGELLKQAENRLIKAGIEEAETDARILFEDVFGIDRSRYLFQKSEEISEDEQGKQRLQIFLKYIEQRCSRKPVQYITGKWNFMGMEVHVNENVLIPRFDTECLVEKAADVIPLLRNQREENYLNILDMCTGSGCIAISLKKLYDDNRNLLSVTAVDLSEKALEMATQNSKYQNVEIEFIQSDLFEHIDKERKFDIIVSNPPYIKTEEITSLMPEVRSFEPMMALDGDLDGLKFYRKIIDESKNYIQTGGFILFEIGCEQGMDVRNLLEQAGYEDIEIIRDLAGLDRVVAARYGNEVK